MKGCIGLVEDEPCLNLKTLRDRNSKEARPCKQHLKGQFSSISNKHCLMVASAVFNEVCGVAKWCNDVTPCKILHLSLRFPGNSFEPFSLNVSELAWAMMTLVLTKKMPRIESTTQRMTPKVSHFCTFWSVHELFMQEPQTKHQIVMWFCPAA